MNEFFPPYLLDPPPTLVIHPSAGDLSGVLDKGIDRMARVIYDSYVQWDTAELRGVLQRVPPAFKVAAWIAALVIVSVVSSGKVHAGIAAMLLFLAVASRVRLSAFYPRVLAISFIFGFLVPLPSLVVRPEGATFVQAWSGIGMLFARTFNSLTLTFLILWTTPSPKLLRGFQVLGVPRTLVWILALARQYLFILARTVQDMHLARKSRQLRRSETREVWRWEAERLAQIWGMTRKRCEDVAAAMRSRGVDLPAGGADR